MSASVIPGKITIPFSKECSASLDKIPRLGKFFKNWKINIAKTQNPLNLSMLLIRFVVFKAPSVCVWFCKVLFSTLTTSSCILNPFYEISNFLKSIFPKSVRGIASIISIIRGTEYLIKLFLHKFKISFLIFSSLKVSSFMLLTVT